MVHVIKVHLDDPKNGNVIRRLTVSSDVASDYKLLKEKIKSLFQLQNDLFEMKWKDSDNDYIFMSSDEELAQALANAEEGLLRVFLYIKDGEQTHPKTPEAAPKNGVEHPLVTCDGCDKDIFGDRYKCLQCKNFDLCSLCNADNKHPNHDMVKLVKPTRLPREWVFCGARRMWKSMFGAPAFMMFFENDKDENKPSTPQNPNPTPQKANPAPQNANPTPQNTNPTPQNANREAPRVHPNFQGMPDAFANIINGDLNEAQKFLSGAIGAISNLLPGGIEVKLEQHPIFRAECKVKPNSQKAKANKESSEACANSKPENKAAKPENQTAQPKKVETPAEPKEEETVPVSTEQKKVETAESILLMPKFETVGLFPVPTLVKNQVAETVPVTEPKVDKVPAPVAEAAERVECKEKSPVSDADSSTCADGWTFIHEDETSKQEPSSSAEAAAEATEEVHYPKLEEMKGKLEEGSVIQTNDPKIINALIKMQAMGFTNEGGWLERLLITKHGNINEALDALYPFAQRQ